MSQFTEKDLNQYDLRPWKEYLDERLGDLEKHQVDKRFLFPLLWRLLLVRLWAYFECPDELLHEGQLSAVEVWEGINASVGGVGNNINHRMAIFEEKNPSLRGVLTDSAFFRWSYFADEVLRRLILDLSSISRSYFANFDWAGIGDVLDQLIDEQLLKQADLKRYLIPSKVRDLMVALLEPQADWEVSDPFCGLGQLLVKACSKGCRVFGQEKSGEVYELARLSIALRRLDRVKISQGDVITAPMLLEEQGEAEPRRALGLQLFDGVVSILPLLQEEWGRNATLYDCYQRFPFGIPAEMEGEGAYLQHIVKTLKADGRAVVLIPPGFLFRERDLPIRRGLVDENLLVAVIALPPNLFYDRSMPTVLLVLQRSKSLAQERSVLFMDGTERFDETTKIIAAYHDFKTVEGFAQVVSLEEIQAQNYSLSVSRYLMSPSSFDDWEKRWHQEMQTLATWQKQRNQALQEWDECFRDFGVDFQQNS